MFVGCVHMCVCCMDVCVCEFTVHVRVWHMCGMCASVCVCVQRVRKCIFKLLVTSSSSAVACLSSTDIPLGITSIPLSPFPTSPYPPISSSPSPLPLTLPLPPLPLPLLPLPILPLLFFLSLSLFLSFLSSSPSPPSPSPPFSSSHHSSPCSSFRFPPPLQESSWEDLPIDCRAKNVSACTHKNVWMAKKSNRTTCSCYSTYSALILRNLNFMDSCLQSFR